MMGSPGAPITIRHESDGTSEPLAYDTIPQFHKPIVHKEHMSEDKPYDMQNWNTWKVMREAHLIKPLDNETMALWRTPEATYLAIGYEQNWTTEYWSFGPSNCSTMLVVSTRFVKYRAFRSTSCSLWRAMLAIM